MTCKDCIHCEACERMISDTSKMFKALLSEILKMNCDIKYDSTNILSGAEICQCFQDRSRFVELPCKVGDSYFEIEQYCTERGYYNEPRQTDTIDCEYCDVDGVCDRQYRITEKRFASLIQIFGYKEKAADKYNRKFLTKEEAEAALKEREANANDLPQSDNHS